jgi:hypothetical protein
VAAGTSRSASPLAETTSSANALIKRSNDRLAYERAYWQRNPDKARECARRHREKRAEHYRAYEARYRQENRARCNAWARAYQVAKDRRTPP